MDIRHAHIDCIHSMWLNTSFQTMYKNKRLGIEVDSYNSHTTITTYMVSLAIPLSKRSGPFSLFFLGSIFWLLWFYNTSSSTPRQQYTIQHVWVSDFKVLQFFVWVTTSHFSPKDFFLLSNKCESIENGFFFVSSIFLF